MTNMINNSIMSRAGVPLLEKILDLSSARQRLIAGNIANISTPGYKSQDIDFHGELNKALASGEAMNQNSSGTKVIEDKDESHNGINFVNIDKEMARMAENQIYFNVGVRLIQGKFEGLRKAITSK